MSFYTTQVPIVTISPAAALFLRRRLLRFASLLMLIQSEPILRDGRQIEVDIGGRVALVNWRLLVEVLEPCLVEFVDLLDYPEEHILDVLASACRHLVEGHFIAQEDLVEFGLIEVPMELMDSVPGHVQFVPADGRYSVWVLVLLKHLDPALDIIQRLEVYVELLAVLERSKT